jgi:hypothetical protein
MNTTAMHRTTVSVDSSRRKHRLVAVVAGVAIAVLGWLLIEPTMGIDLRGPSLGTRESQDIVLGLAIAGSLIPSLGAWGLLALLERFASHPRRVWTMLTLVGLVLSLGGPLSGSGITAGDRLLLVVLHLGVAGAVIPLLYRTAKTRPRGKVR